METRTRHLGPFLLAVFMGTTVGPHAEGSCQLECELLATPWWNCYSLTHECSSPLQSETCIDGVCGFFDAIGACIPGPLGRVLLNCDDGEQYPIPLVGPLVADGAATRADCAVATTPVEWAVYEGGELVGTSSAGFAARADRTLLRHSLDDDPSERPDLAARNVVLGGRGGLTPGARHHWRGERRFPRAGYLIAVFAVDSRGEVVSGSGRVLESSYEQVLAERALVFLLDGLRFEVPSGRTEGLEGWALLQIGDDGYAALTMRY